MMKYAIKNKKDILMRLPYGKDISKVSVVCLGSDKIEQYIEPLEEVPITTIPFLLNEESIIFIEELND